MDKHKDYCIFSDQIALSTSHLLSSPINSTFESCCRPSKAGIVQSTDIFGAMPNRYISINPDLLFAFIKFTPQIFLRYSRATRERHASLGVQTPSNRFTIKLLPRAAFPRAIPRRCGPPPTLPPCPLEVLINSVHGSTLIIADKPSDILPNPCASD